MTHKFSQSHFRIQTRSQRRREGPRPRRLTKVLGLHPDGFSRAPNVFQATIDCMRRTHEALHPGKLFLDQYESTLARPIHTHNKDPALTNLLDVLHDEGSDEVGLQK